MSGCLPKSALVIASGADYRPEPQFTVKPDLAIHHLRDD